MYEVPSSLSFFSLFNTQEKSNLFSPSQPRLLCLHCSIISRRSQITSSPMEESDAVPKPVVVDPPLYNEAPPSPAQRRPVVVAVDPPAENHLIQRIQRALVELRELRNQFNAILRELELEVGEDDQAESSVEDPEDSDS